MSGNQVQLLPLLLLSLTSAIRLASISESSLCAVLHIVVAILFVADRLLNAEFLSPLFTLAAIDIHSIKADVDLRHSLITRIGIRI